MHACVRTCLRLFETNCLPRSHWHARSAYAYVYIYIYIYSAIQVRKDNKIKPRGGEGERGSLGGGERESFIKALSAHTTKEIYEASDLMHFRSGHEPILFFSTTHNEIKRKQGGF